MLHKTQPTRRALGAPTTAAAPAITAPRALVVGAKSVRKRDAPAHIEALAVNAM